MEVEKIKKIKEEIVDMAKYFVSIGYWNLEAITATNEVCEGMTYKNLKSLKKDLVCIRKSGICYKRKFIFYRTY